MIVVEQDGHQWEVEFGADPRGTPARRVWCVIYTGKRCDTRIRQWCRASTVPKSEWDVPAGFELHAWGVAFLGRKDQFNRKLGRRIALTRALGALYPSHLDTHKERRRTFQLAHLAQQRLGTEVAQMIEHARRAGDKRRRAARVETAMTAMATTDQAR